MRKLYLTPRPPLGKSFNGIRIPVCITRRGLPEEGPKSPRRMTAGKGAGNPPVACSRRSAEYARQKNSPLGNRTLSLLFILWILRMPFAAAEEPRCNKCYRTVYESQRNTFKLKHSFRAHMYVNPFCYNISTLAVCSERGTKYWIGQNIGTPTQKAQGECPEQEDWVCFNFKYITKKEDLEEKRYYEIDLIKEVVIDEQKKQETGNPLFSNRNLFVDLAEKISKQLNLTNCWVCGGTLESETWPWRGVSVGPLELLKLNYLDPQTQKDNDEWILSNTIIGDECIWRRGKTYTTPVGETVCKRYLVTNGSHKWWIPKDPEVYWSKEKLKHKECIFHASENMYKCWDKTGQPYTTLPHISKYWASAGTTVENFWEAPQDLYWLCGKKAYSKLPSFWSGSCTLGAIQPSFFLLAEKAGDQLGISLYDELKRSKRYVIGGSQKWGKDEWPPERILATYGPATWAADGSWGYRTPIYMLNRIIRLQALLEIITNQTSSALELLSTQQTQTRAAVYQNRLALDYLLAEEGGVCGKFNTSDCCLHIDDNGEAVKKIAQNIRKLAHVPVQTWHSITTADWWNNLFQPGWWKKALVIVGLSLASFLFLPCLIPCFIKLITSVVTTMPLIQDLQMNRPPQQLPQKILALKETKKEKRNRKRSQLVYDKFHKQTSLQEEVSTSV